MPAENYVRIITLRQSVRKTKIFKNNRKPYVFVGHLLDNECYNTITMGADRQTVSFCLSINPKEDDK